MKKKTLLIIFCVIFLGFSSNVYAATSSPDGSGANSNLSELKDGFNNSNPTLNVTDKGFVTVYGKSVCSASSKKCTYSYQGLSEGVSVEELLKKAVKCTNGEKNILYDSQNVTSAGTAYKDEYSGTTDQTIYWSEDYYITCSNTSNASTGNTLLVSDSDSTTNSGDTSNSNNNSSSSSNDNYNESNNGSVGNTSSESPNQGYNSSTTVNNSETGVETYYIVLVIIAAIAFGFMYFVKKHNLFKNI